MTLFFFIVPERTVYTWYIGIPVPAFLFSTVFLIVVIVQRRQLKRQDTYVHAPAYGVKAAKRLMTA